MRTTGPDNSISKRICAAWLCPEEYSQERVLQIQKEGRLGKQAMALAEMTRALTLDPASPWRWADAGQAYSELHNIEKARYCFEKAVERGPNKPAIRIRAANFYFGIGDTGATMRNLAVVLSDPTLQGNYPTVFLTYTRMGVPVEKILSEGVPPNRPAAQSYLRFVMESKQVSDAEAIWDWIAKRKLEDSTLSGEYVRFLLQNEQAKKAEETWMNLNSKQRDYRRTNWIFNGKFEQPFQPSPFDWKIDESGDVQVKQAKGFIELTFDGKENIDYHHFYQLALLNPGKWKLQASVRTQAITTDKGVSLRAVSEQTDASTNALKGTNDWTELQTTFQVHGGPKTVRIEVMRTPSLKFENAIAGLVFVRSVALTPAR